MQNAFKALILAVAILVMSVTVSLAQDFQKGYEAYQKGDYATALQELRPLAEQGYAPAQYNLGDMYRWSLGVSQDYAVAVKWYRKAAEQGNTNAQYNLGDMYRNGWGVAQDYARAMDWFRKAAKRGHTMAQGSLDFLQTTIVTPTGGVTENTFSSLSKIPVPISRPGTGNIWAVKEPPNKTEAPQSKLKKCPSDGAKNNCFGTVTYSNGEKYDGEWKDNKKHGQGAHTWPNGDKYVGEYKDGVPFGQGTYTHSNGNVLPPYN